MYTIQAYSAIIIFVMSISNSCVSNKKIVIHYKDEIGTAKAWGEKYIKSDTLTGIKIQFENYSDQNVYVILWNEPIDTIVHISHSKDVERGLPDVGKYDITEYRVGVKNQWFVKSKFNIEPESNSTIISIGPGQYFIKIYRIGYIGIYLKNLIVKKQKLSFIKTTLLKPPIIYY